MAGKVTKRASIRKNTIEAMKRLGTYKPQYNAVIDIYSEMREQYEFYTKQLSEREYKCEEYTADGSAKKSPLIATIETLRKDILMYSDRLQLNPKSLEDKTNTKKKPRSKLDEALKKLG